MRWNEEAEEHHAGALRRRQRDGPGHLPGQRVPSVRTVNAAYSGGLLFTSSPTALSRKMEEIRGQPHVVALSGDWFTCHGDGGQPGLVWPGGKQGPGRPPAPSLRQLD